MKHLPRLPMLAGKSYGGSCVLGSGILNLLLVGSLRLRKHRHRDAVQQGELLHLGRGRVLAGLLHGCDGRAGLVAEVLGSLWLFDVRSLPGKPKPVCAAPLLANLIDP